MSDVKVYTTSTCPWCHQVKNYLKDKGVAFQEINVAEEPQQAKMLVDKTGQRAVPVIEIGDEIVIGFNRQRLEELL